MHVDSVATNAARRVIQPLDDVAAALGLSEADFATVPWNAGIYNDQRYAIPLDVHPLGFFYNKAVMEKAGLDPEKPPMTADEYCQRPRDPEEQGHPRPLGHPVPVHRVDDGAVPAVAVRRRPVLRGRHHGHLGRRGRGQGDDLVHRPGQERALAGQDRPGRRHRRLPERQDRLQLERHLDINTLKEKESLEWGVAALPNIGGQRRGLGRLAPVRAAHAEDPGREQEHRRPGVRQLDQPAVPGLGEGRAGAGPQRRSASRRSSRRSRTRPRSASRSTSCTSRPRFPGIGDAYLEWEKALNESVLGIKEPQAALSDAAGRANKILEANKKKYGVSRHGHRDRGPAGQRDQSYDADRQGATVRRRPRIPGDAVPVPAALPGCCS